MMQIPKGWCLVPETPTDLQLAAAQEAWLSDPQRRTSTIYMAALDARPDFDKSLLAKRLPHQYCKTHGAAPLNVWACPECLVMLRNENKRLREALLRLRRWNMGGSFHGGVVIDLQDWIDAGMVGDLPEYPEHLPPIKADPVAALAETTGEGKEADDGCGACGDGCKERGSCRLADESPSADKEAGA